jgi:hemerythrin-like domain-containing protein
VHLHHRGESAMLFPSVRASAPKLNPVVDRLEADHLEVSALLDKVEAAAGTSTSSAGGEEARRRLADALEQLSEHLFEHLSYEEKMLAPVINSWKAWPFY